MSPRNRPILLSLFSAGLLLLFPAGVPYMLYPHVPAPVARSQTSDAPGDGDAARARIILTMTLAVSPRPIRQESDHRPSPEKGPVPDSVAQWQQAWTTPVYTHRTHNAQMQEEQEHLMAILRDFILQCEESQPSVSKSNRGGASAGPRCLWSLRSQSNWVCVSL